MLPANYGLAITAPSALNCPASRQWASSQIYSYVSRLTPVRGTCFCPMPCSCYLFCITRDLELAVSLMTHHTGVSWERGREQEISWALL